MRYSGKLHFFNSTYGFVTVPGYVEDICIYRDHVVGEIEKGDYIEFDVVMYKGRPQGRNVSKTLDTPNDLARFQDTTNVVQLQKPNIEPNPIRALHLYMPWNPGYIPNQMYQLRDHLEKHGHTWIPKINSTKDKVPFDMKILDIVEQQLKKGIETCLYMTNFHCIHIWKIEGVHRVKELPSNEQLKTLQEYKSKNLESEFWFKVSDVYVLQADHDGKLTPILHELEKLSLCREDFQNLPYNENDKITPYMSAQRYPAPVTRIDDTVFFAGVSMLSIDSPQKEVVRREKWLNTHRKVTKEYNLMREHLAKNIYTDIWPTFNNRTQHFLIEMEMLKIESASYNSLQAMQFGKQKFECYISALINELDDLVGKRIISVCEKNDITYIGENDKRDDYLESLLRQNDTAPDLIFYFSLLNNSNLKSILYRQKLKLEGESRNILEDILQLSNCGPIMTKLNNLRLFRNWFSHDYFDVIPNFAEEGKRDECLTLISQVSTILNLISSPYSQSNVFMDLYEFKYKKKSLTQTANVRSLVDDLRPISKKIAA